MEPRFNGGGPNLADRLCFALYAAARAITRRYRPLLDEMAPHPLSWPTRVVVSAPCPSV